MNFFLRYPVACYGEFHYAWVTILFHSHIFARSYFQVSPNLSSTVGGGKSIIFRVFRAVGRMVVRVGV